MSTAWLVPGVVTGVLELIDLAGLGQPRWYVAGVKLLFCALSLAVPAAMYWAARRHFGEAAARVALLVGAFWYELVGFAHKPMTEFVATAPPAGAAGAVPAAGRGRFAGGVAGGGPRGAGGGDPAAVRAGRAAAVGNRPAAYPQPPAPGPGRGSAAARGRGVRRAYLGGVACST